MYSELLEDNTKWELVGTDPGKEDCNHPETDMTLHTISRFVEEYCNTCGAVLAHHHIKPVSNK